MKVFSHGELKTLEQCQFKHKLIYVDGLFLPDYDEKAQTGNDVHTLIYRYLSGIDVSKYELTKSEEWQNFLNFGITSTYLKEFTFNVRVMPDAILSGRVDAVLKNDENYIIADWKTGKFFDPTEDLQTLCYLYGMFNYLKHTETNKPKFENLSMKYFFLAENKEVCVNLTGKKYLEYEKRIKDIISKANKVPEKNLKHCKNCPVKKFCVE